MRYGKWIDPVPEGAMFWDERAYQQCSLCGKKQFLSYGMKYCPHCGARMDGTDDKDWISVRDQLPALDEDVLVCAVDKTTGEQGILIANMEDTVYCGYCDNSKPVKVDPRWYSPCQYFTTYNDVTHWMPLPQPPDKEQDQDERKADK